MSTESFGGIARFSRAACASLFSLVFCADFSAYAFGIVAPVPVHGPRVHAITTRPRHKATPPVSTSASRQVSRTSKAAAPRRNIRAQVSKAHKEPSAPPPQDLVGKLSTKTIAPGVEYKFFRGPLNINVIDVNMSRAAVQVRPALAGNSFNQLTDVKNHAKATKALAAVNANYFKKDGTPLGTLIIDKEWVAGPLYDRVSLGITNYGYVRIDRVNLFGTLDTSNPSAPSIWVNNINQPRRHGSRLILYTRRWGDAVRMPYAGCLVSVDRNGVVVDKRTTVMPVPAGGFVLSDTKSGQISRLKVGDLVKLNWHTRPEAWADVEQAVSGGPMLIKDGELYLDLKAENFRKAWTGRQIHARTAAGVTAYNHLLLVTIEGPHTLWDFAKFLRKLGAVDAMNLDGGGSTTMVVEGRTVTKNANSFQRRVASSLAVIDASNVRTVVRQDLEDYIPSCDLTDFCLPETLRSSQESLTDGFELPDLPAVLSPAAQPAMDSAPSGSPLSANPVEGNLVSEADLSQGVP